MPLTSFVEPGHLPDGTSRQVWIARADGEPMAFFAGIWCQWTSARKLAASETTDDLFGFLTTEANRQVGAIHPKAMPVILTRHEELDVWINAAIADAVHVQRPLPDGMLRRAVASRRIAENAGKQGASRRTA